MARLGKKPTLITRLKMNKSHMGNTNGFKKGNKFGHRFKKGEPSIFAGKNHSDKTKIKISKSKKANPTRYWLGKTRPSPTKETIMKMKKAHNTEKYKQKRLLIIVPFKDTSIERMMQDELSARGYGYYKHFPIIGQPDLAFPDKKIAIFCDGDYWHNLPRGKQRDEYVNTELQKQGWLVLRYWGHEINVNTEAIVDEIEDTIFER